MILLILSWLAITHLQPNACGADKRDNFLWFLVGFLLTLLIGFRHEVGSDWPAYIIHLGRMKSVSFSMVYLNSDPGYALLNWIGANIFGGIYFVNTVCAILFSYGLISFCRVQVRPWLAFTASFSYLTTVVAMGYSRQGVAAGLAMLALTSILKNKTLNFFFWIALAATFHKSAVILVPLILLSNKRHKLVLLLSTVLIGILLFVLLLQEYIESLNRIYISSGMSSGGGGVRILMTAGPAILFLYYRKRFLMDERAKEFWKWMSIIALVFVVLLFVSPSTTAVDRIALYWIPLQLAVLSGLPDAVGTPKQRNLIWSAAIIGYSMLVFIVWLLFSDYTQYWVPYRFYPWEYVWNGL